MRYQQLDTAVTLYSHGFFFSKQKTAYEMRISDWSSDVCSSDLFHTKFFGWPDSNVIAIALAALWHELTPFIAAGIETPRTPWQMGRASGRERVCQYV